MPDGRDLLVSVIEAWVADPEGDVVYAEEVEGRWAVRMTQTVRDATTVWWDIGERSIRAEAYVVPAPEANEGEVYRLCLVRNGSSWRTRFALDREGAVVIRGRIAVEEATAERLDMLLAEVYELVETTFRPLARLAFARPRPGS